MVIFIEIIKRQAEKRMQKKKKANKGNKTHPKTNANEKRRLHCIKNIKLQKESM